MNPYRQAREVENDALARMTSPSPREEGWDEGFAAGRAAATPDPAPFFTEQQERALARCEGYDEGYDEGCAATPDQRWSYRVRDRDSDYKAMCHEDRDHAELLLKAWLSDGRDAVIESRIVYDVGWTLEP